MLSVAAAMAPGSPHLVRAPPPPGARHVMSGPSSAVSSLTGSPMMARSRPSAPGSAAVTSPGSGFGAAMGGAAGWGLTPEPGTDYDSGSAGHYSLAHSPGSIVPPAEHFAPRVGGHPAVLYNDSRSCVLRRGRRGS